MSDFLEKCVNSERQVKEASQLTLKQTIRIFVDYVDADKASCLIQRSKREAKFPIVSNHRITLKSKTYFSKLKLQSE